MNPVRHIPRSAWRAGSFSSGGRAVPEEAAVALTYNGSSYAVMMATPADLEDFAYGFSLNEEIVSSPAEIEQFEAIGNELGIELRMWLSDQRAAAFAIRKRHLAGPTGCGLCGLETLSDAMREPRTVKGGLCITPEEIMRALQALPPAQSLNHETRAVHAAGFWEAGTGMFAVREDVGRHNALDKLAGAIARSRGLPEKGIVVVTSRVSVEMVQKTAAIGASIIVAVSAPTALAIRTAEAAGITLVGIARQDGFEVFTHKHRIENRVPAHV